MIKRIFDLGIVLISAVVWLPVLAITAGAVAIRLGLPVFFVQERIGMNNERFALVKFRTMTDERDAKDELLPDADRQTTFGRFLRSSSLDELPELWNVIRGSMSLVGPRPLLTRYLTRYTPQQARRHEVRPGLTGLAQISGRNSLSWEEKFELDVWYIDNRSIWFDIKILALTVLKTIRRDGISAVGEATMPEFLGQEAGTPPSDRRITP